MEGPCGSMYGFGTTQRWCPALVPLPLLAAGAHAGTKTAMSVLSLRRCVLVGCGRAGLCLVLRGSCSGRSPEEPGAGHLQNMLLLGAPPISRSSPRALLCHPYSAPGLSVPHDFLFFVCALAVLLILGSHCDG